jgi:hypothetical protein
MTDQILEFPLVEALEEKDKARVFEQYKLLVDSLNNTNQVRENSNNFWMAVNGLGLTAIAYIIDLRQSRRFEM